MTTERTVEVGVGGDTEVGGGEQGGWTTLEKKGDRKYKVFIK